MPIAIRDEIELLRAPFRPPTISEWAERYRVLGPPSQEKGPLRLDRTPYWRPILDMVCSRDVERVVLCKSAQIAGTEFALNIVGYYAHIYSAPVMVVLADEDTAVYVNRERIQRMFLNSPELSKLVTKGGLTARDVLLNNGATITIGWASSVARLASRPFQVVVLDEVDKPGYNRTTDEGDPISLAIQRTETFHNRKIIILSTPTVESGNIWKELTLCDAIYTWHVPCHSCGVYQPMVWNPDETVFWEGGTFIDKDGKERRLGRVVWDGDERSAPSHVQYAWYRCGECGEFWDEIQRRRAVLHGVLVPKTHLQGVVKSVGFFINRLYSLLGPSGELINIVRDFLKAHRSKDRRRVQAFVNNVLAEPYRSVRVERPVESVLALRDGRPSGVVPANVILLTAGIDVQDLGFYYVIRAWGQDMTSWLVRYGYVDNWEALINVIFRSDYCDDTGETYSVRLAFIDSGGHRTGEVYTYCRKHAPFLCPIKGHENLDGRRFKVARIDAYPDGKPIPGGLKLYHLDVNYLKDVIDGKLSLKPTEPGAFVLNADANEDYARQLLSEVRDDRGRWVVANKHTPNHYLDAEVYALAAAIIMGIERMTKPEPVMADNRQREQNRPVLRSRWMVF